MSDVVLEKEDLDFLVDRLKNAAYPDEDDIEESRWLRTYNAPPVSRPKPRPVDFVSEEEIRAALKRKEKIVIGSKTIITPAARDLAAQHDVFTIAE